MKTILHPTSLVGCSIILCIFCSLHLRAQERTLNEVKDSAYAFLTSTISSKNIFFSHTDQESEIIPIERNGTIYMYLVNIPENGWILISNEQQYKTILGYSLEGVFDMSSTEIPLAVYDLLYHHMNMIDSLRQDGAETFYRRRAVVNAPVARSSTYTPGNPLLYKNDEYLIWKQSGNNSGCSTDDETQPCCQRVYNKYCPTNVNNGCGHALAGCGAVAMGQLMCYWGWPNQAEISDTIQNQFFCLCGVPSNAVSTHFYDWEHIPSKITSYTNMYEVDNIAKLLRDCGYAAQTYYVSSGSAAMMEKIDIAMRTTFHYHATYVVERPNVDVASMIRTDINAMRPVMSQAWIWEGSDVGIHTFLVDGYDNNDFFHINFGWGGVDNGWYDLGFNGYSGLRNFLTEVYPDCNQLADLIINPNMTIYGGDSYILYSASQIYLGGNNHNLIIKNNGYLLAEAGDEIILSSGFHAENGSNVHLKIRDFCDATGTYIRHVSNQITNNEYNCHADNALHRNQSLESIIGNAPAFQSTSSSEDDGMQNISDITTTAENSCVQKFFRNGQLLILRDGKTYNVTGMEVE